MMGWEPDECPACATPMNVDWREDYDPMRHDWIESDGGLTCPTCGTEVSL